MNYSWTELIPEVARYLDSKGYQYTIDESEVIIYAEFPLENRIGKCTMDIVLDLPASDPGSYYIIKTLTQCPLKVPAEKRSKALEFIARASYGKTAGSFIYHVPEDCTDGGAISYASGFFCYDEDLPWRDDIEVFIEYPLQQMAKYGDAIYDVLMLDAEPEDALRGMEG